MKRVMRVNRLQLLKTVAFRGALAGRSPRLDSLVDHVVKFPPRVYGYRQTLPWNRRDAVPTHPRFPSVQKPPRPADTKKPLRDISRRGCRQLRITPPYVNFRANGKKVGQLLRLPHFPA